MPQNGAFGEKDRTSKVIGDQLGIGKNTVERAAEFTLAVDKIISATGITRAYKVSNDIHFYY